MTPTLLLLLAGCDLRVEVPCADTWYEDLDGDGFGVDDTAVDGCSPGGSWVDVGGDCDDTDPALSPQTRWWPDADGDGAPDTSGAGVQACQGPTGWATGDADCDDTDPALFPGADERCDGVDNDCDGAVDDDDSDVLESDLIQTWPDRDGDGYGYGDIGNGVALCPGAEGRVEAWGDCDDGDASRNPGMAEVCNDLDDDCDGAVDEDFPISVRLWADADGDGYGAGDPQFVCDPALVENGYVANDTDCDDTDPTVHERVRTWPDDDGDGWGREESARMECHPSPGRTERLTDCDDTDPTVTGPRTWYIDTDLDGKGSADTATSSCTDPGVYWVDNADDCDDSTTVDDGPWPLYVDEDGDGYGDGRSGTEGCDGGAGTALHDGDCNDDDDTVHPDATEICGDGIDQDCDGRALGCGVYAEAEVRDADATTELDGDSSRLVHLDGVLAGGESGWLVQWRVVHDYSLGLLEVEGGDHPAVSLGWTVLDASPDFAYPSCGDLDGDGIRDVVLGYDRDQTQWLAGPLDPEADWAALAMPLDGTGAADEPAWIAGDLDGDGADDLGWVSDHFDRGVFQVDPVGDGTTMTIDLSGAVEDPNPPWPDDDHLPADFDGDGASELVFSNRDDELYVVDWEEGSFDEGDLDTVDLWSLYDGSGYLGDAVGMGDYDGDGYDDLVVDGSVLLVLAGPLRGSRTPDELWRLDHGLGVSALNGAVVELDGVGGSELVLRTWRSTSIYDVEVGGTATEADALGTLDDISLYAIAPGMGLDGRDALLVAEDSTIGLFLAADP